MRVQSRTVLILAVVALIVAILRYFIKGWIAPLGLPAIVGSLLASITVVLLVGLVLIFAREGRAAEGRYLHAAVWYVLFAAWCQVLVISGILLTQRSGAVTYYEEGPWERMRFPNATQHALMHAKAFLPMAAIGLVLGGLVYWIAQRGRKR